MTQNLLETRGLTVTYGGLNANDDIDILLAPPRIEMAEMVTTRDVEKVLSLLRQLYEFVIIDTRAALSEDVLVFLDSADLILQILLFWFFLYFLRLWLVVLDTAHGQGEVHSRIINNACNASTPGGLRLRRFLNRSNRHCKVHGCVFLIVLFGLSTLSQTGTPTSRALCRATLRIIQQGNPPLKTFPLVRWFV